MESREVCFVFLIFLFGILLFGYFLNTQTYVLQAEREPLLWGFASHFDLSGRCLSTDSFPEGPQTLKVGNFLYRWLLKYLLSFLASSTFFLSVFSEFYPTNCAEFALIGKGTECWVCLCVPCFPGTWPCKFCFAYSHQREVFK